MRTTDNYGFKLIIAEPDMAERTVVVCPRYNNLRVKWTKPSGKMYFQKALSGTVKFWGVDFVTVHNCALRTKFTLVVYKAKKGEVARCEFRKTDCKWDVNHGVCEVDVSTWNPYKKLEAGKDNEYNLVKFGLTRRSLQLYVNPVMQIYVNGDDKISVWRTSGLRSFYPNCTPNSSYSWLDLRLHYKFVYPPYDTSYSLMPTAAAEIKLTGVFADTYNGIYKMNETHWIDGPSSSTYDFAEIVLTHTSNTNYKLVGRYYSSVADVLTWTLYSGSVVIWSQGSPTNTQFQHKTIEEQTPVINTSIGIVQASSYSARAILQGRLYLINVRTAARVPIVAPLPPAGMSPRSWELEDDDIYKGNMEYAIGWPSSGLSRALFQISDNTSDTDQGYGRVENTDTYYAPPDNSGNWSPVFQSSWWEGHSLWAPYTNIHEDEFTRYRQIVKVDDFYTLGDAIKAVINKIDDSIVFEPDTDHSRFLFNETNPVQPVQQNTLYITQKSNVLNLNYDYPAWQAPITWGKIETLLNNAFNCYWDIYEDGNGVRHLRIEHRTFYERGGTYDNNALGETHDLRLQYRNSTPFSYAEKTNRWEWDKDGGTGNSSANRYEYSWMDTQSAIFDGETIEVPEAYRLFDDERVEERKIDWFSSDIDFLTIVPSECSSDGFAIVMEDLSNNGWIISGNPNYNGQNYNLALEYLQPLYLLAGIYSPKVQIGDNDPIDNPITARMRKAEIEFRLQEGDTMEPGDMLITEVGKGVTDSLEIDLASGKMFATIRYDNE